MLWRILPRQWHRIVIAAEVGDIGIVQPGAYAQTERCVGKLIVDPPAFDMNGVGDAIINDRAIVHRLGFI
jgi:hypothetical protein